LKLARFYRNKYEKPYQILSTGSATVATSGVVKPTIIIIIIIIITIAA